MAENVEKLSRIGKQPVAVPNGVEVTLEGQRVRVKGPKGELTRELPSAVEVTREDGELVVSLRGNGGRQRALHGLSRALLANMVHGVDKGFERVLEINGVGYRADVRHGHIVFHLGYSHPILFEIPNQVTAEVSKDNKITLRSIDKELLGLTAAKIRGFRPPEPYKGKGIKYADETILRKAGKAAAR